MEFKDVILEKKDKEVNMNYKKHIIGEKVYEMVNFVNIFEWIEQHGIREDNKKYFMR